MELEATTTAEDPAEARKAVFTKYAPKCKSFSGLKWQKVADGWVLTLADLTSQEWDVIWEVVEEAIGPNNVAAVPIHAQPLRRKI